ncbi:MAG: polyprenyl synthetase family protein [bacterium]|nr:polyprenyl synthetase family protein [bacterium]
MILEDIYKDIKEDMIKVEELLKKELSDDNQFIQHINNYLLSFQGKRLRPAIVLLTASAFDYQGEDKVKLAAAIELLHTATLIHDDIIDEADTRRFKPTLNTRFGPQVAVLSGDLLYARALYMLAGQVAPEITRVLAAGVDKIVIGEIEQISNCYNPELTQAQYLGIIAKKTGSLMAACPQTAAMLAGRSENEVEVLRNCGLNIGIAFQIVDDCLDLISKKSRLGKPVKNDHNRGKLTLPLIYALDRVREEEGKAPENIFDWPSEKIAELLGRYQAIDYSFQVVKRYIDEAKEKLEIIEEKEGRERLKRLFDYIVEREY